MRQAEAPLESFVSTALSVPGPGAAAPAAPGGCEGLPASRAAAAAAAARRHAGDERVHELAVEGHVDEGVDAAVEGVQPEQPAEGFHWNGGGEACSSADYMLTPLQRDITYLT